MDTKKNTVLVAGGAGFIGSHLCRKLLSQGYKVICADNLLTANKENLKTLLQNKNFKFIKHDITKPLPKHIKAKIVFHLASPASPNHHSPISYHALAMETMMANTTGTLELLNFSSKNKAKFLFASTSEIYGDPQVNPQTENYFGNVSTTGPRSVYDEAKRFGETLTAYFWRKKNLDARIVRIFNTYGPGMHKDDMRMSAIFVKQALYNLPITIFGNGKQTRSLCFIDDVVEGLMRLMFYSNTKGQIVNLGNPQEHTVLEYAKIIKKITKSKSKIVFTEKLPENDPKKRRPNITKAKKLLRWEPKTPLQTGLNKLINYIKKTL